jgi:hypothetical protein
MVLSAVGAIKNQSVAFAYSEKNRVLFWSGAMVFVWWLGCHVMVVVCGVITGLGNVR